MSRKHTLSPRQREITELRMFLDGIKEIIEAVDQRAMAADGPVTPTLKEMTQAEMTEIYKSAVHGSNRAAEFLATRRE